jgi:4-amino-4-deoxy-L-arabinose transferase-like glycosyltransferase
MEHPERVNETIGGAPPGRVGPPGSGRPPRPSITAILILLFVGAPLFFWRLGSHDLWPPDEPRFALVAREMRERADPIVLSVDGGLYTDKPPLFFWAINAFASLRGGAVDEWAARLPSACASLLSLGLVLILGTWLYDERSGLLAALVFALSPQIAERARWASIDMTLNLFVLGAIVMLWRARARPCRAGPSLRCAWLLMALATLAKGPIGVLLPLLAILPVLWIEGDRPAVRRLFLPSGVLLFLAIVLAWLLPWAVRLGAGRAAGIVWHQTGERYVDAWNGRHPVWYYLWQFPANFFPWILFLPTAVALAFSARERSRRSAAIFLVAWIAAIFLFFSFSTGKRALYIIPLYPAASILVGHLLARGAAGEEAGPARRRLLGPLVVWASLAPLLAAALPILARRRFPELVPASAAIGGLLLAGAWAGLMGLLLGRRAMVGPCLAASMLAAYLVIVGFVQPWIDRYENIAPFAREVRASLDPGVPFSTTEQKREAWVFYTRRLSEILDTDPQVIDYLSRPGPRDLLIEDGRLESLRGALPDGLVERARGRVSGQRYVLVRREAGR